MLLYCVLVLIFLVLVLSFFRARNSGLPPGPRGLPILGYLPWLNPEAPHETLTELAKKYGPIYGLYLGGVYTVVISDHKLVREALAKDATTGRAPLYLTHGIMKGYGLICAEKELWKDQRKFVCNSLKLFGIAKYGAKRNKIENLIATEVSDFIEHVKNMSGTKTFAILDPLEPLRHNLGSAVNLVVFGRSWSRQDQLWKWLQHLQEEGTKHIGVAGPLNFLPFLRFVPKYKNTMTFLLDGKHKTHRVYREIIDEQFKAMREKNSDGASFEPENVVQAFLVEKERRKDEGGDAVKFYGDEQFYHLVADIFGAGLDTTLTTLRWYLLYMAAHPNVQDKVQEELDAILQKEPPQLSDLPNLPLTEASLAEAQRIRSVVPIGIPHGTIEATRIGDYKIPKGAMIVPLQWAVHMNGDVWKDPETFDPARFLDEEGKFVRREAFIPFQTGKRMCVGDEFARMLLFLFGAAILKAFRLSVPEGASVDFHGECGITLTPKPHELVFTIRKKW